MIRHSLAAALAASTILIPASAAFGQNGTEPATATPPATTTERPAASTPPAPSPPEPVRTADPEPRSSTVVVAVPTAPAPQQVPPSTIELQDQPYPNGFADPNAAFGNDLSVQVREQDDGFDWGLLGLLGLLGLFGLRRPREGYRHVVHAERYDDGRPPRT